MKRSFKFDKESIDKIKKDGIKSVDTTWAKISKSTRITEEFVETFITKIHLNSILCQKHNFSENFYIKNFSEIIKQDANNIAAMLQRHNLSGFSNNFFELYKFFMFSEDGYSNHLYNNQRTIFAMIDFPEDFIYNNYNYIIASLKSFKNAGHGNYLAKRVPFEIQLFQPWGLKPTIAGMKEILDNIEAIDEEDITLNDYIDHFLCLENDPFIEQEFDDKDTVCHFNWKRFYKMHPEFENPFDSIDETDINYRLKDLIKKKHKMKDEFRIEVLSNLDKLNEESWFIVSWYNELKIDLKFINDNFDKLAVDQILFTKDNLLDHNFLNSHPETWKYISIEDSKVVYIVGNVFDILTKHTEIDANKLSQTARFVIGLRKNMSNFSEATLKYAKG